MTDANAYAGKHRKSDTSEAEKQTRASRLSARTRAKVCYISAGEKIANLRLQERLSNGSARDEEAVSDDA